MKGEPAVSEWIEHAGWWLREVADDPIYQLDVLTLASDLIGDCVGVVVDLGCGEGQMMRTVAGPVIGCDISHDLLTVAQASGPVVRSRLPNLSWLRPASVDVAYAVMVLEHLEDLRLFAAATRVVRRGGVFVVAMNHPAFTAAGAGPIIDPADGEILWRWGSYFGEAAIQMPTSEGSVTFYHRPMAAVLNAAADAGWMLDRFVEAGFSEAAIATEPGYVGQEQMPRLLGIRWTKR